MDFEFYLERGASMSKNHTIAITGALGQIAYSLIFRLLSGELLGVGEKCTLQLLDLPEFEKNFPPLLMEIEDAGSETLTSVTTSTDPKVCFKDASIVFMLGAKPRTVNMERKDLLLDNGEIFQKQGRVLSDVARRDAKILVVGNPSHTNCLIALKNAKELSSDNFSAMSTLDENRARALLSRKIGVPLYDIGPVAIWGNHSNTLVPDVSQTEVFSLRRKVVDCIESSWLNNEFIPLVQERGKMVIAARGKSSAASAASAAILSMKSWLGLDRHYFSTGRLAKNNPYGIDEELVFTFPFESKNQELQYAKDRWTKIPKEIFERVAISQKELQDERAAIQHLIRG